MLQLPYRIECPSHGAMSFCDSIRWDSAVDPKWSDDEIISRLRSLFVRTGDKAANMRIERADDNIIVYWTMNYGRLSPRDCSCILEPKR